MFFFVSYGLICCCWFFFLGIEDLCAKRDELQRQILIEEEDKHKLENEIRLASEKLAKINENLAKKITARTEFDRTISETESAYMKILESSQTLLNVRLILIQFFFSFLSLVLYFFVKVLKRESHSLRTKVDD